MNIKSLLLGSAAALAAVSGAQAADAIVAAEPEPMEYVRVCDAFGEGFFYIPGTETCLKVGGWVRFQVNYGPDVMGAAGTSDYDASGRGYLTFEAKNDSEYGTVTSFIGIEGDVSAAGTSSVNPYIDEAYLGIGGFKAGYFYGWWDKGLNGEQDQIGASAGTQYVSAAYTYDSGSFQAGISLDELQNYHSTKDNDLGVSGIVSASLGGVSFDLIGGYDTDLEEGAVRALLSAEIGPGTLQVAGIYSSEVNAYYDRAEWSVAASYAYKATDKLTITPGVQYMSNIAEDLPLTGRQIFGSDDAWRVGLTVGYQITDGLRSLVSINYDDPDNADDSVNGFVRLQRDF